MNGVTGIIAPRLVGCLKMYRMEDYSGICLDIWKIGCKYNISFIGILDV